MALLMGERRARTTSGLILILGLAVMANQGARGAERSSLGLSVNSVGVLTRNGTPYRGIGVNYYDAFIRTLRNPQDDSYRAGFAQLGAHGIPFARFNAGGFLAADVRLYLTDRDSYLRRLDGVVAAAEKAHVGLIASLFWSLSAVSDAVHEPRARWADEGSATRQLMRKYTQDIVSRYVNSPAVWGWEFSNELSLPLDRSPGSVPPERALSYDVFQNAALDFAGTVRKIDPRRILLTGNSLPRPNAYHDSVVGRGGPDTEEQFARILLRDNPGPYKPICIHASQANAGHYFADRQVSFQELLEACVRIGRTAQKPVYLEEFIPMPYEPDTMAETNEREYFSQELKAIENSNVPLASVWEYDRKLVYDRFSLTFNDEHSYMLQMIAEFDRTVHSQR
jgi:hypothetical protein